MVVYIAGCIALIALRRRSDLQPAGFVAPFGPAIAVIASVLSFVLLANASGRELMQLVIAAMIGVVILAGMRALSKRK
jgi:amino acid transporter